MPKQITMRQGSKFDGRYRSSIRHFSTEANFLRFAKARDEEDLTKPLFANSDFMGSTTLIDVPLNKEPVPLNGRAKGVSA